MDLAGKRREDAIRRRIRELVDGRKVAISAIALKARVDQGTVKAVYENSGPKKQGIMAATAGKLEAGLDEQERALGMVKRCGTCGRELPVGRFSANRCADDGLQSQCKECVSAAYRKRSGGKGAEKVNDYTKRNIDADIVRKVKAEDKRDVESKYMAPYFGLEPKQLDEIRRGIWDKLLLTPMVPKRADSVLEAVELLRGEVALLRREVESVMMELGVDVKTVAGATEAAAEAR